MFVRIPHSNFIKKRLSLYPTRFLYNKQNKWSRKYFKGAPGQKVFWPNFKGRGAMTLDETDFLRKKHLLWNSVLRNSVSWFMLKLFNISFIKSVETFDLSFNESNNIFFKIMQLLTKWVACLDNDRSFNVNIFKVSSDVTFLSIAENKLFFKMFIFLRFPANFNRRSAHFACIMQFVKRYLLCICLV